MSLTLWLLLVGGVAAVLLTARRLSLGRRTPAAVACRAAAVGLTVLALGGWWRPVTSREPQRVVYLVDGSMSMDERQAAWIVRRVASLDTLRPAGVERALAVFGEGVQLVEPFGRGALAPPETLRGALEAAPLARDTTNLEAALLGVTGLPPHAPGGRIVLLSDGRETSGSVDRALPHLRALGWHVFPEPVPAAASSATAWEDLVVSPSVRQGAPVRVMLLVHHAADAAQTGRVTVGLAGIPVKRQTVTLRPGWQTVTVPVPALAQGTMPLQVTFEVPAAGIAETREAFVEVQGPPRVLFVGDDLTVRPWLAAALERREMDVALARPADLPEDAADLEPYDAVLLFNLPKSHLGAAQVEALRTYLAQRGGGLVHVGLGGDLAHEITTPAPLDELLPVIFEAKGLQESRRRVCMIMLIDRSASMLGARLAATKRAAIELVNQLAPEDLVGVYAFDTRPYVLVEVQPAGQASASVVNKLAALHSRGGTDVLPALTIAEDRLQATDATLKHVILLSDGNTPFEAPAYRALAQRFRDERISVSTIGVGAAFINKDYLEWVARATGGTFYLLQSLEELPRLVARDTHDALGRLPFAEGSYRPEAAPGSEWFTDGGPWPVLAGFLTATAKPEAQVELVVRTGASDAEPDATETAPLLARWMRGRGRVAAFLSDASTRWSPDWIRWPGFEGWAAQVVRWTLRPRIDEELFAWVDRSSGTPQLVLEGVLEEPMVALRAAEDATEVPLGLIRTGRWRWQAALEGESTGWYRARIESGPPDARAHATRWVLAGAAPASGEVPGQPPRETVLRRIAEGTGGVYAAPDRAFVPPTTTVTARQPLFAWWLPFVFILVLIDVAVRGGTML